MDIQASKLKQNIFLDIDNYTSKMSISKVIKFFQKQNILFTKTMIQNYIRIGVLPELVNKRYYTKKHLVFLMMIYDFKDILKLEDLKQLFAFFESYKHEDDQYIDLVSDFNQIYNKSILSKNIKDIKIYDVFEILAKTCAYRDIILNLAQDT